jgi:hypothetical protein
VGGKPESWKARGLKGQRAKELKKKKKKKKKKGFFF